MRHGHSAALRVVAQSCCAENPTGAPCPDRLHFAPCDRWHLLDLVTGLRRALGLTASDIAVLRALLSFLPVQRRGLPDAPVTPDMLTVVFASNDQIGQRAGGTEERVLRHCFRRLAAAGLLRRKDSATGKRFPIRRRGRIVDAYGLDLAPGFALAPDLADRLATQQAEAEQCRALRTEILARRRALLEAARGLTDQAADWLGDLTQILRRKLDRATLVGIGQTIADLEQETAKTAAADGRNYRHTESEKIDLESSDHPQPLTLQSCWNRCTELSGYYPTPPRTLSDLREIIFGFGKMLTVKTETLVDAAAHLGWTRLALALDYIARRAVSLSNPTGYLRAMLADALAGGQPQWDRS